MPRKFLYGASGHAKVVIDILSKNGVKEFILLDDNQKLKRLNGYLINYPGEINFSQDDEFLITIGDNKTRERLGKRIDMSFFSAIHPSVTLGAGVSVGQGSVIMAGAVINPDTRIGRHCIINTKASIDHDCCLEDFVHVAPGSTLCGGVTVGEGTLIGAGATVVPNVKIGRWVKVAAGAVIIQDIADNKVVIGVPAREKNN